MGLELRQQLKLSQQLVMTPQLQQAIKLLQLSRLELVEMVNLELLENPFLEEKEADFEENQEEISVRDEDLSDGYTEEIAKNADWEDYLGDFGSASRQLSREFEVPDDNNFLETRYSGSTGLVAHLNWQIRLSSFTAEQMDIAEFIVGNLNSSGYLDASLEEIAALAECSIGEVEAVLKVVQLFDPTGVAARNVQECLMIQVKLLKYDRDPILVSLIENHLEDLEARRYQPIFRKFKLNSEDLREYLDVLQSLDPMPGASFGSVEPSYIAPDVYVYKIDGEFLIALNEEGLPQLQLSSLYSDSLMAGAAKSDDKEYFQERMRSASWLIRSLHQRQRTLYKVAKSILKHQEEFFSEGPAKLRPLILKEIADDVEMHESTISRVTTNKYIATPFGVHELKYFFNSSLSLDDGSEVGSESVKLKIKDYIDAENKKAPLSDDKISDMLKEELQVNIARRTVAKYRTALNIPSSSKRRDILS